MNKVNQVITDYIINMIEVGGLMPWSKPWSEMQGKPQNLISGKSYSGINAIILSMGKSPYWLTMNQVRAAGGQVKKGSKTAPCIYYKLGHSKTKRKSSGEPESFAILRYYRLFNVADCTGIEMPEPEIKLNENQPLDVCDRIVNGYKNSPTLKVTDLSNSAYYSSMSDEIVTPSLSQFDTAEDFYSTLFHEMGHSTGHSSRLNRNLGNSFGSHSYSKEELVAEFCASFLCREAGIDGTIDQSASYLANWLTVLKDNPEWLIWGAQQAQKAYDHILGTETLTNS
jgi:antirestriction protein ArdC